MINQFEDGGEEGSVGHGLRVDLDLRSKGQEEQPEWMDSSRKKRGPKKKGSPKPIVIKPTNPIL